MGKERGSALGDSLETKAKDFLSDVKQKRSSPLIPHYDSDDSSGGSSFGKPAEEEDDWGSDWEEWEEEEPEQKESIKEPIDAIDIGIKEVTTVASMTPTTPSTATGSCCFIPSIVEQKTRQEASSSHTTTAASAAAITTVAAIAAASPAVAELIGGPNGSNSQKAETQKEQEDMLDSSGPKPLVSLMEFDSSKSNSLKFPTLPVNIPEAFDAPTEPTDKGIAVNQAPI